MADLTEREHSELVLLYESTRDDIEKAKNWGWTLAYTTVALQGAAVALFSTYVSELHVCYTKMAYILFVLLIGLIARNHITRNQLALARMRTRISSIRSKFSATFQESFGEPNPKIPWSLELMVWVGTAFSILFIVSAKAH